MTLQVGRCMSEIVAIQRRLQIADPVELQTAAAVLYTPDAGIPDSPFWANTWTLRRLEESAGSRQAAIAVAMSCYVDDADPDQAARIATSFWTAAMDAFARDTTLNGACRTSGVIPGQRSLHTAGASGRVLIGTTLVLQVELQDFPDYA